MVIGMIVAAGFLLLVPVARAPIQEGDTRAAKPYVARTLAIDPTLGRVWIFKAPIGKADRDYGAAVRSLTRVESMYPRDRAMLNQMGRTPFLKRRYADAIAARVPMLALDPEDQQAHDSLMLCHRGLTRMLGPEDNNERQLIHEHDSVPLGGGQ